MKMLYTALVLLVGQTAVAAEGPPRPDAATAPTSAEDSSTLTPIPFEPMNLPSPAKATTERSEAVEAPPDTEPHPADEKGGVDETSAPLDSSRSDIDPGVSRRSKTPTVEKEGRSNGVLIVETIPDGAQVFIGYTKNKIETLLGTAPLETPLPAGTYFLRVVKEGREDAVAKVDIRPGENNWFRLKMLEGNEHRRAGLRLAGNLLLWPGLAVAGTGIGLIFAGNSRDSRPMAQSGFGLAAAGVVMLVTGGIILGVTYRSPGLYSMPSSKIARGFPTNERRFSVLLTKRF